MSRSAKTKRSEKRKATHRAAKEARKALYKSYSIARHSKRKARRTHRIFRTMSHPNGKCGNIGCGLCNPVLYNLLTPTERAQLTRNYTGKRLISKQNDLLMFKLYALDARH